MNDENSPSSNQHKGWYSRGYQPHCDYPGLIQSIGFRLFDSVPEKVVARWKSEFDDLPTARQRTELCDRIARYEDMGNGCCWLSNQELAKVAENSLLHFDGVRYELLAWCVMSNHVHVLVIQKSGWPLAKTIHSWKSFTAHQANKLLNRTGEFWFSDYFDQYMKTTEQYHSTVNYIEFNPVTANLVELPEDWWFSSAHPRHRERVQRNRLRHSEVDPKNLPDR